MPAAERPEEAWRQYDEARAAVDRPRMPERMTAERKIILGVFRDWDGDAKTIIIEHGTDATWPVTYPCDLGIPGVYTPGKQYEFTFIKGVVIAIHDVGFSEKMRGWWNLGERLRAVEGERGVLAGKLTEARIVLKVIANHRQSGHDCALMGELSQAVLDRLDGEANSGA